MAEQPISSRLKVEDGVNKPDFFRAGRGHEMTVEAQDGKVLGGELTPWRIQKKAKQPKPNPDQT